MTKINQKQIIDFFNLIAGASNYDENYITNQINLGLKQGIDPFGIYEVKGRPLRSFFEDALYYNNLQIVKLLLKYSKDNKIRSGLEVTKKGRNKNLLQESIRVCSKNIRKELLSHAKYEGINILETLNAPIHLKTDKKNVTVETNLLFSSMFGISGNSLLNNLHIDRNFHTRSDVQTVSDEFEKWWYSQDDSYQVPKKEINLLWDGNRELMELLLKGKIIDLNLDQEVRGLTFLNAITCLDEMSKLENTDEIIEAFELITAYQVRAHSGLSFPNGFPGEDSPKSSQTPSSSGSESKSSESKAFDPVLTVGLKNAHGKNPRNFNIRFDFSLVVELVNETIKNRRPSIEKIKEDVATQKQNELQSSEGMNRAAKASLNELSEDDANVIDFYNTLRALIKIEVSNMTTQKRKYFVENDFNIKSSLAAMKAVAFAADVAIAATSLGASSALASPMSMLMSPMATHLNRSADKKAEAVFDITVNEVHAEEKIAIKIASAIAANMISQVEQASTQDEIRALAEKAKNKAVKAFVKLEKKTTNPLLEVVKKSHVSISEIRNKKRGCSIM